MRQILKHIKYFFFLAWNWDLRIAIALFIQEIKGEHKYGIDTTGSDMLLSLKKTGTDISNSTFYMPVSYQLLENTFTVIPKNNRHHFVDIGCGKGRALCVAGNFEYQKLTGVDFSEAFCNKAISNLELTQKKGNDFSFNVEHANAENFHLPPDADTIFFFNPFNENIVKMVVANIKKSLQSHPRKMFIIYVNPINKQLFERNGFEEFFYKKTLTYLEVSILTNKENMAN